MVNYCLALPILPGKGMELVKKFAQEHGGHTKEHDEFYRIAGISREQVWIQRSPPGSAYGIDFTGPPPSPNENIVDWQDQK